MVSGSASFKSKSGMDATRVQKDGTECKVSEKCEISVESRQDQLGVEREARVDSRNDFTTTPVKKFSSWPFWPVSGEYKRNKRVVASGYRFFSYSKVVFTKSLKDDTFEMQLLN